MTAPSVWTLCISSAYTYMYLYQVSIHQFGHCVSVPLTQIYIHKIPLHQFGHCVSVPVTQIYIHKVSLHQFGHCVSVPLTHIYIHKVSPQSLYNQDYLVYKLSVRPTPNMNTYIRDDESTTGQKRTSVAGACL